VTCARELFEAEQLYRAAHRDAAATGAPVLIGFSTEVLGDVLMHRRLMRGPLKVRIEPSKPIT